MSDDRRRLFVLGSYVSGLTIRVERPPAPGETLVGRDFDWGPGGKGFNQAVAAARLGADVELAAAVGDDVFGRLAFDTLARESVRTDLCFRLPGIHSGIGFVTLTQAGENTIVLDLGANLRMTPALLAPAEPRISACGWFLTQLELPLEAVRYAIAVAGHGGAFRVLNPAPAGPLPDDLLCGVDLLTPNETELRILSGLPPDSPEPTEALALRLRDRGVKRVVVTRGAAGALVVDDEGFTPVPALRVKPVDTTGAGDAFNGCLVAGLMDGLSLRDAAARAAVAGGYCTQHLGVIHGLPTRSELDAFGRTHVAA